jgi:hypothetical protein
LIQAWNDQNTQNTSSQSYQTTQSSSLARHPTNSGSNAKLAARSTTTSLDSTPELLAEDHSTPESSLLEILETQQHSSSSAQQIQSTSFVIQIPPSSLDKSKYEPLEDSSQPEPNTSPQSVKVSPTRSRWRHGVESTSSAVHEPADEHSFHNRLSSPQTANEPEAVTFDATLVEIPASSSQQQELSQLIESQPSVFAVPNSSCAHNSLPVHLEEIPDQEAEDPEVETSEERETATESAPSKNRLSSPSTQLQSALASADSSAGLERLPTATSSIQKSPESGVVVIPDDAQTNQESQDLRPDSQAQVAATAGTETESPLQQPSTQKHQDSILGGQAGDASPQPAPDAQQTRSGSILAQALTSTQSSVPWQFESQLPDYRREIAIDVAASAIDVALSEATQESERLPHQTTVLTDIGTNLPRPLLQSHNKSAQSPRATPYNAQHQSMEATAPRQSPRLQAASPAMRSRSPRLSQPPRSSQQMHSVDDSNKVALETNMQTSPLARVPPRTIDYSTPLVSDGYNNAQSSQEEPALTSGVAPQATIYDPALGASALPIQQSIEEEPESSADSIQSKASSSQLSLRNERVVPHIDGVSLPTQPVFGPEEYLIPLPAEGKIQSVYTDLIDAKRKTILKFIHRRGSVGSANGSNSRTTERNEMIELMERLQDTTTHMDLGLPDFATQYSVQTQEATAYAEYAGSKFVFLSQLLVGLATVQSSIVIASKPGPVCDLLAAFLTMKKVTVRRHDLPTSARSATPEEARSMCTVDLVTTTADHEIALSTRPNVMIAFDASFDNQSSHIRRIRELYSIGRDQPLPVIHLLVANSAEHIDRCLRKAMPSPQRLKLLVRGTYLAHRHLGGDPSYIPSLRREPDPDATMDVHTFQREVRKSPNRKVQLIAWIVARATVDRHFSDCGEFNEPPDIQYDELAETPPKLSENTTAAATAAPTPRDGRLRTRSPASRSATPSGKKRVLDADLASSLLFKRQRMTPMRDTTPQADTFREPTRVSASSEQIKASALLEKLRAMTITLEDEKQARLKAEGERDAMQSQLDETDIRLEAWERDHSGLLRRYEKQREHNRTLFKENKRVIAANESYKVKNEKLQELHTKLRGERDQVKTELDTAHKDLVAQGGDKAALEEARAEARKATERVSSLEKSLENTKRDFEFTRQQYQQASSRATELATQTTELETQVEVLKRQASGELTKLKELNNAQRQRQDLAELERVALEYRSLSVVVKKLDEENKMLKKNRGVQTRGNSAQPPSSPGMGFGRRSRQNSPAVGAGVGGVRASGERDLLAVPGARDRVSAVRNEP